MLTHHFSAVPSTPTKVDDSNRMISTSNTAEDQAKVCVAPEASKSVSSNRCGRDATWNDFVLIDHDQNHTLEKATSATPFSDHNRSEDIDAALEEWELDDVVSLSDLEELEREIPVDDSNDWVDYPVQCFTQTSSQSTAYGTTHRKTEISENMAAKDRDLVGPQSPVLSFLMALCMIEQKLRLQEGRRRPLQVLLDCTTAITNNPDTLDKAKSAKKK
ncbi:hypothetical protein QBC35DRAFT_463435 [Podospora australis]|uniref:Uncharacterized protein n=1 Tax=Podospora australis TaxID=1536484 RepID=A0AAN7AJ22_9PEZI|nr:hypothetical protein QBC35DRAFT_463435 [Podospora australis]